MASTPITEKTSNASPVTVICMVSGLLSLFLLPIVLAPLALITGFVGMGATERRKHDTGNCTIGMVAAGIAVVIFLVRLHDATGI